MKSSNFPAFPASIRPVTADCPVEVFRWGGPRDHHPDDSPHAHPFDEILLFNQGGGVHWIAGTPYPVRGASIHFIRVGTKHQLSRDRKAEGGTVLFLRDYLALEPEIPFKQLFFLEDKPVLDLNPSDFAEVWLIFSQMLRESGADPQRLRADWDGEASAAAGVLGTGQLRS